MTDGSGPASIEPSYPEREWLTIALIVGTYAGLALLMWFTPVLPFWVVILPAAYLVALHMSLQHEALHGHPTRNARVNELMISINPSLWFPYRRYRKLHLQHHNDEYLTDPVLDPESYYMLPDDWAHLPGIKKRLYIAHNTLAGRMVLGPIIGTIRFWSAELRHILSGDQEVMRAWLLHIPACGITLYYAMAICGIPFWAYIALFAWPGIGLALVRSFCEHQAVRDLGERTIIVEAGPFFSFLFLYNNLHIAHHSRPRLAWYNVPAYYRAQREELLALNNGYLMHGYREIFRRFLLRPKEPVAYPDLDYLKPHG
jgi:fatty acid desaturase